MADIATTYLGIALKSPVIIGACPVSSYVDRIKQAEQAGAGAVVIRSLFEEQLQFDAADFEQQMSAGTGISPEMTSYQPVLKHGGSREHLFWVKKARQAVKLPLIGSVNAENPGNWTKYSQQLADAGCDAIELNIYAVPADINRTSAEVEERTLAIVKAVVEAVDVPVSVKLSPWFGSVGNVVKRIAGLGAKGVVLFNRFIQPTIDVEKGELVNDMPGSNAEELRLPLRWTAILAKRVPLDLCLSTGVHTGADVARAVLAGASAVQVASVVLEKGLPQVSAICNDLKGWMDAKKHKDLAAFRAKLASVNLPDPFAFERAQYVRKLIG